LKERRSKRREATHLKPRQKESDKVERGKN